MTVPLTKVSNHILVLQTLIVLDTQTHRLFMKTPTLSVQREKQKKLLLLDFLSIPISNELSSGSRFFDFFFLRFGFPQKIKCHIPSITTSHFSIASWTGGSMSVTEKLLQQGAITSIGLATIAISACTSLDFQVPLELLFPTWASCFAAILISWSSKWN